MSNNAPKAYQHSAWEVAAMLSALIFFVPLTGAVPFSFLYVAKQAWKYSNPDQMQIPSIVYAVLFLLTGSFIFGLLHEAYDEAKQIPTFPLLKSSAIMATSITALTLGCILSTVLYNEMTSIVREKVAAEEQRIESRTSYDESIK